MKMHPQTKSDRNWILWIILIVGLSYGPFLGSHLAVLMHADERVYVAQSLEMAQNGNWFLQSLQGQPNYHKGPLHYLLVRMGFLLLGKNLWATLYMNFLLLIVGAASIGALVKKYCPHWKESPIWAGGFFATCFGLYSFSFSSQMEVELACLFALGLFLLDRTKKTDAGFLFWVVAGLAGWCKSPLHAILAGSGAILFWIANGDFSERVKNLKAWLAVLTGIFVCALGYFPAFFMDRENFVRTYVLRETFNKSANGIPWWSSLTSLFGFNLLPWIAVCLVVYAETIWFFYSKGLKNCSANFRRGFILALSWIVPTLIFFIIHPYHFHTYDLPVISGVILFIFLILGQHSKQFKQAYKISLLVTACLFLLLPLLLTAFFVRFSPAVNLWPSWLLPFSWITSSIAAVTLSVCVFKERFEKIAIPITAILVFYLSLGTTLVVLGQEDLSGLQKYLQETTASGRPVSRIAYLNLEHDPWTEWGVLSLWLHSSVEELRTEEELRQAIVNDDVIIAPWGLPHGITDVPLKSSVWRRLRPITFFNWLDWVKAYREKDISFIEVNELIFRKLK
jgi:hypothetical protein